ncbi:hypothetical protein TorRG33x02_315440 [Trema orientale]|uniref:Uncharacterized protein n=1 Tax=Trema orientale TaxID=63057 RepID=A0A2P5BN52_TREOI|nr:hypothetical protein TorRG33x02_315440 [Trema orientale]
MDGSLSDGSFFKLGKLVDGPLRLRDREKLAICGFLLAFVAIGLRRAILCFPTGSSWPYSWALDLG